jgi:Putative Flp pilus-assembly TadE/G-like
MTKQLWVTSHLKRYFRYTIVPMSVWLSQSVRLGKCAWSSGSTRLSQFVWLSRLQPVCRRISRTVYHSRLCKGLCQEDEGSVLLLTALSMVVVCGFGALAIDAGVMMAKQQQAQAAADAGALAGASNLLSGAQAAANTAYQYATSNDPGVAFTATADTSAKTVSVSGTEQLSLWLARDLGFNTASVGAHATGELGTLVSSVGIVPLAVPNQQFYYGEEVSLSEGAGNGQSGNYGFLDLSGQGANGLETDLAHGYTMSLSVGEQVPTKPGVMSGPVEDAIDYRMNASANDAACNSFATARSDCSRVMYLPVVDTLDVSGKKDVTILGFAAFYLDGLVGNGGDQSISGRFIQMIKAGELGSGTDYGLETVKLSQ